MVLTLLVDYSVKTSFWVVHKLYDGAIYLYYGKQETPEEKILRELQELKEENKKLKESIQVIEKEVSSASNY